ncbi:MAG: DUF262 domain-containing protein [Chitinophagaceae bacterium]|nr:MAG: DUF262 domain-containing protein [Chitinophagaceae bacterium]
MSKIYSKEISFSTLKKNFDDCIYAIPQLQRNYVWDKNRVCLLLDSIFNHYPIGVSLIWKAKNNMIAEIKPNNRSILPSFNVYRRDINFIIDGQQRLTSLYGLIAGISEAIDFNSNIDFRKIYFSVNRQDESRFYYIRRYAVTRGDYIPVHDIIKDSPLRLKQRFNLNNQKLSDVRKLKSRIQSYRFHFIYLETNLIDEVRETFVRINSQGMTVGKADALFARTTNIGLRDLIDYTRRALIARQYNEMKPESFIYTLSLSKGEKEVGKRALDNFEKKFKKQKQFKSKFQKEWKKYHKAFLLAVDYLAEEFEISRYSLLPSDNIFTILSLFFYLNNGRPSAHQKKEIKKWFWHTTIGERYSGSGFNRNIPKDIELFHKLVSRANHKYIIDEKINPNEFLKKDYRKTNFSAVIAYYLFLKTLKPKYLETGELMMLEYALSKSNKNDRHHIFPGALLGRRKVKQKLKNSIVNICFLAANENQSVSDDPPKDYLEPFKRKRFFKSVMRAHLIPTDRVSGIWESDVRQGFKTFINQRAGLILKGIAKTAGVKRSQLFEKFDEIKRV